MITKDHLIAFAAGAILATLLMWFIGRNSGAGASERIIKLRMDSLNYVDEREEQAARYRLLDSAYRVDMERLSSSLDSVLHARSTRPRPRINDADSLRRAILRELYQR